MPCSAAHYAFTLLPMRGSKLLLEFIQILAGIALASIGLKAFLIPNGFLDGGVTGISILFHELLQWNTSFSFVLFSIPFLWLAWKQLGGATMVKSIASTLLLAGMIEIEVFNPITDDKLLIAVFGGLFVGAGLGLTIKNGAVLDGGEILGLVIQQRWGITVGMVNLLFNLFLFALAAFFLSTETALYSMLTYLVTARVTDLVIHGFEDHIGLLITTPKANQLMLLIQKELGAGSSIIQSGKGYGKRGLQEEQQMVHCVISRLDIRKMHRIIDECDPDAFVVEYNVNHVKRGIMRRYLPGFIGQKDR